MRQVGNCIVLFTLHLTKNAKISDIKKSQFMKFLHSKKSRTIFNRLNNRYFPQANKTLFFFRSCVVLVVFNY